MAARNILKVMPLREKWLVKRDENTLSTYRTKKEALEFAQQWVDDTISSRLLVYRMDGSVVK